MEAFSHQAAFVRAGRALAPYLGDIVIAGAWAHRKSRTPSSPPFRR